LIGDPRRWWQFGSAGGLVLLSGKKLGPQIFLPLVLPVDTAHVAVFSFLARDFPARLGRLNR